MTAEWPSTEDSTSAGFKKERKYTRENLSNGSEILTSRENKKLISERITNPEDPKVGKIIELTQEFNPEEADTPEIIMQAIGDERKRYHYILISDEQGVPLCHTQGSYLEIGSSTEGKKQAIAFLGFAITRKENQRQGLATEATMSAISAIKDRTKEAGAELKATVVEGTEESEAFWNYIGLKRPYYEDSEGNFHELPYIQPPIAWDPETGKPLDPETGEIGNKDIHEYSAPEHLMLSFPSGKSETNIEELMPMIDSIYRDNYVMQAYRQPTEEGLVNNIQAIEGFKNELAEAAKNSINGRIYLFSADERAAKTIVLKLNGKELHSIIISSEENENYSKY